MSNLSTTIAVYPELSGAEEDWGALESAARTDLIDLADAALVKRSADGTIERLERQSHHGWGKGAVAGSVVGLLFPPSIIGTALAGSVGGAVIARLNRSLDRGDIKDLGEVMDSGEIALVVVTTEESVHALDGLLTHAETSISRDSASAEDVRKALQSEGGNGQASGSSA